MAALLLQPDALTLLNGVVLVAFVKLRQSAVVHTHIPSYRLKRISLLCSDIVVIVKRNYLVP